MDPFSSQRQSNVRTLESLQLAQAEIARLNAEASRLRSEADRLRAGVVGAAKREWVVRSAEALRADLARLRKEAKEGLAEMAGLFGAALLNATRKAKTQGDAIESLRIHLASSLEAGEVHRRESRSLSTRLDRMADYASVKADARQTQTDLARSAKTIEVAYHLV
jgi:regulator of replication initiation timing